MSENTEQRVCIKFCQKLGKTATETYEMVRQAFGDEAMSRTRVFEWHRRFKEGRQSVESEERPGRPSTSKNPEMVEKVRALVLQDRRITIREICDEVGISMGSCHSMLTENLGMKRVAAKFVPRLLTPEQKELRVTTSSDLHENARNDPPSCLRLLQAMRAGFMVTTRKPKPSHLFGSIPTHQDP